MNATPPLNSGLGGLPDMGQLVQVTGLNQFALLGFAYLAVTSAQYEWSSIGYNYYIVAVTLLTA
jgi:hypothetical protein